MLVEVSKEEVLGIGVWCDDGHLGWLDDGGHDQPG
jgi:hypothetical protein